MKKFLIFAAFAFLFAASSSNCSMVTCADLQKVCNRCSAADKALCEAVVKAKDVQGCSSKLAIYQSKCK